MRAGVFLTHLAASGLVTSYLVALSRFHVRTFALSYIVMCCCFLLEAYSSLNRYKEGVYLGETEKNHIEGGV